MSKPINWIKANKKYLNISAIANEVGLNVQVLHNTISNRIDGHGTPFKVPEKYHTALAELVDKIKKGK